MAVEDVGRAWQRVVSWLEAHAPVTALATASSALAPATPEAIDAAQERMGVVFPPELRTWLLTAGMDGAPDAAVEGVLPGSGGLLGLGSMERRYGLKTEIERDDPSDAPDCPFWHEQWIPVFSDSDACYGTFLDARTGRIGSFGDGDPPSFGVHASLSALFAETAGLMARIAADAPDAAGQSRTAGSSGTEPAEGP